MAEAAEGAGPVCSKDVSSSPDLDELKNRLMTEIEAKMSQKEETMWRRGQVEIRKIQLEQKEASQKISQMQERQSQLVAENQRIRGALVEVTSKFELVVKEMREVLRSLPQRESNLSPSPSVASTSASEVRDGVLEHSLSSALETPGSSMANDLIASADRIRRATPPSGWMADGVFGESTLEEDTGNSPPPAHDFCTPPRASALAEDASGLHGDSSSCWRGATASPAVLSLASALPSASTVHSVTPNVSPGLKRLALAECLEQQGTTGSAQSPQRLAESTLVSVPELPASLSSTQAEIKIELTKEPGFVTLGIEVNQIEGQCLIVESIDEHGLVGRYNASQEIESKRVQIGDHVVEVNGARNDPTRMLTECKNQQKLNFSLVRDFKELTKDAAEASASEERNSNGGSSPKSEGAAAAELSSPVATRLRPEARVFVPSAQKESGLLVPPGLEANAWSSQEKGVVDGFDSTRTPAQTSTEHPDSAMTTSDQGSNYEDSEEVKRTLFREA